MGRLKFTPPENPSFTEKLLAVTVSAEGGTYDAINMWDTGICSVGLIQFIDVAPQFGVCNLLGAVADSCGIESVVLPLDEALKMSGASFKRNNLGQWRFFLGSSEVKTAEQQKQLYFCGSNSLGTVSAEAKLRARTWAAGLASIWQNENARQVQVDFTLPKLNSFSFGDGRKILLEDPAETSLEGWPGAVKAFYMAYAVNLPTRASQMVAQAAKTSTYTKWSPEWCLDVMYTFLAYGNVGVWKERYNSKRPWLEKMFGVVLPKDVPTLLRRDWIKIPPLVAVQPTLPVDRSYEPLVFPTKDFVVESKRTDEDFKQALTLKTLQWLPFAFGMFWKFISWIESLFRHV